jgi:hypothetical protein
MRDVLKMVRRLSYDWHRLGAMQDWCCGINNTVFYFDLFIRCKGPRFVSAAFSSTGRILLKPRDNLRHVLLKVSWA